MACFDKAKIHEHIAGDLAPLESRHVRDHLLICPNCRQIAASFERVEKNLRAPVFLEPPDTIIRNVMRRLYSPYPLYSSIAALILASLLFLVSWIYIYFNFANNSLIQAMHLTQKSTSNWLFKILNSIETLFMMIQATLKACSHILHSLLHIHVDPGVIGGVFFSLSLIVGYLLFGVFSRVIHQRQK